MADTSYKGILSLNDVKIRQNKNVWPNADPYLTITHLGNQLYQFDINTQSQYRNQFLYYVLGNGVSATDFEDNSVSGQLFVDATGNMRFTKKFLSTRSANFVFQLRTGSLTGANILTTGTNYFNYGVAQLSSVEFLAVAGGAGASGGIGGGGGGGGVITGISPVTRGVQYNVVVGAGSPGVAYSSTSTNGSNTSVFGCLAVGGGGAGVHDVTDGVAGGSGGGAASNNSRLNQGGASYGNLVGPTNTGTAYGNRGGHMSTARAGSPTKGAGGGGAGGIGVDTNPNITTDEGQTGGGAGGPGILSSILGTPYYFGGGGGGGGYQTWGGWGGLGGGAPGGGDNGQGSGGGGGLNAPSAASASQGGSAGTNTGGGGGSANWQFTSGGAGGSGVVVIRYPAEFGYAANASNGSPNVSVSGGYISYKFWQSGSITF